MGRAFPGVLNGAATQGWVTAGAGMHGLAMFALDAAGELLRGEIGRDRGYGTV